MGDDLIMNYERKSEAPYFNDSYISVVHRILLVNADNIDAVYEEYILQLVGAYGLKALLDCELIESCGSIDGKRLYTLI